MNWDDLRILLAVGEVGSVSGAARALDMSRATVHRRLGGLSDSIGEVLWDRTPDGLMFTTAGEEMLTLARRLDAEIRIVGRQVAGLSDEMKGPLHLTLFEVAFELFAKAIAAFAQKYPALQLRVTVSNEVFSLQRRDVDVALRASDGPAEGLFGRRIGRLDWGVFGTTATVEDNDPSWVLPAKGLGAHNTVRFAQERAKDLHVALYANTIGAIQEAVALGLGIALLPYPLGCRDARLVSYDEGPVSEMGTDLWVLTHPALKKSAPVRGLMKCLSDMAHTCLNP